MLYKLNKRIDISTITSMLLHTWNNKNRYIGFQILCRRANSSVSGRLVLHETINAPTIDVESAFVLSSLFFEF